MVSCTLESIKSYLILAILLGLNSKFNFVYSQIFFPYTDKAW